MSQLVPDCLRAQAEATPDRVAVIVDGVGQITFAEWEAASNRLARSLAGRCAPGERVALLFDNAGGLSYLVAYMGIHKAGAIAVPVNPMLSPTEVDAQLRASQAQALIHDRSLAPLVARLDAAPALLVDAVDVPGDPSMFQVPRASTDVADILYTSGTTGHAKGVAATHDSILFRGSSTLTRLFAGARLLHAVPLFTFAGTHAMTLIALRGGMTAILQPRFDAARFLALLDEHRVAMTYVVPTMALRLLADPAIGRGSGALRLMMYGTAPMPPDAVRQLSAAFPNTFLVNLYGLTEGGAAVCSLSPAEAQQRPASLGKPMPPTELRIVDDDEHDVAAGDPGEIWMRTAVAPRWYWEDEAATRDAWTADGWLRTGDIGWLDEDGFLYLLDRKKDLIIAGGHNISAPEVEGVLLTHPAVAEAAVVGQPHPIMGEVPTAWVVLREPAEPEALRAFLEEHLAGYKVPRTYTMVSELPRNALGKVLKRTLRGSP